MAQLLRLVDVAAALQLFREAVPGDESNPADDEFEATLQTLELNQINQMIDQFGQERSAGSIQIRRRPSLTRRPALPRVQLKCRRNVDSAQELCHSPTLRDR